MARSLSARDADRILSEPAVGNDLPDDTAPLSRLFATMRTPAVNEPGADARKIASIAAEIRAAAVPGTSLGVARGSRRRRVSTRSAAFALAAVLASGTAAAAATGSLPDPVQRAVASALDRVSISVPHPGHGNSHAHGHGHSSGAGHSGTAPDNAVGPDATGSAKYGLCTAAANHPAGASGPGRSVAFSNLQHAAAAAGMTVTEFCKDVQRPGPGGADTTDPGSTTSGSSGVKGNSGQKGSHGPPSSTPNSNGPETGTEHSGRTSTPAHG